MGGCDNCKVTQVCADFSLINLLVPVLSSRRRKRKEKKRTAVIRTFTVLEEWISR